METATLILSACSLVVSTATLGILFIVAKSTKNDVEETRSKTNTAIQDFADSLKKFKV